MSIPKIVKMDVYPVAGYDSMLLNLSGAHGPYFTRNIVVLTTDEDQVGVGEVPGGQAITSTLEKSKELIVGKSIGEYKQILQNMRKNSATLMQAAVDNKLLTYGRLFMQLLRLRLLFLIC